MLFMIYKIFTKNQSEITKSILKHLIHSTQKHTACTHPSQFDDPDLSLINPSVN